MLLLRTNGTSDACYYSKKIEATKGRDNFRKEMKPNSNPWLLIPVSKILLIMIILCKNKRVTINDRNLDGAKKSLTCMVLIWTVGSNVYRIIKFYTQLNTLEDHSHMANT